MRLLSGYDAMRGFSKSTCRSAFIDRDHKGRLLPGHRLIRMRPMIPARSRGDSRNGESGTDRGATRAATVESAERLCHRSHKKVC
jgi:hypothetical protein